MHYFDFPIIAHPRVKLSFDGLLPEVYTNMRHLDKLSITDMLPYVTSLASALSS